MIDSYKMAPSLLVTSLFAAAVLLVSGSHGNAAPGASATTLELSAQQQVIKKKPAAKPAPRRPAPHVNAPRAPHVNAPHVQRRAPPRNVQHNAPRNVQRNVPNRVVHPQNVGPRVVTPRNTGPKVINRAAGPRSGTTRAARTFTPHGARARTITAGRLRGIPGRGAGHTSIRGHNYSVWRRGYRVRHGGAWRTFVALGALGAIAIAGSEFYPYAYIEAPEDYCDGLTPDGCQLVWQDVETEEGDVIPQCVAYCPWQQ